MSAVLHSPQESTGPSPLDPGLVVLVLGMHRSGTSLVTEILGRLGLWIGDDDRVIGASEYNRRGHFELVAGVEFDNAVLSEAGGTWDRPPPAAAIDALAGTVRPAVESWYAGRMAWTFKDPRLCLTLPVWMPALAGRQLRIVHMLRDPHAVARSLITRNAAMDLPASGFGRGTMRAADAIGLWAEYNRRACLYEDRFALPRLFVWYDQLVEAPCAQIERLAPFLGLTQVRLADAASCVRPELRSHAL